MNDPAATRFRWESRTHFGSPVVPEVHSSRAGSSGARTGTAAASPNPITGRSDTSTVTAASARAGGTAVTTARTSNGPAGRSGASAATGTATPYATAASRATTEGA